MTRNTRVTTPELALQEAEANLFSLFPPLLMSSTLTQCGWVEIDMAHGVRADWSCSGVVRQLPVSEVISWVLRIYAPGVKLDHVTFLSVSVCLHCAPCVGFAAWKVGKKSEKIPRRGWKISLAGWKVMLREAQIYKSIVNVRSIMNTFF